MHQAKIFIARLHQRVVILLVRAACLAAACSMAWPAFAQGTYPDRPITLLVPFAPGGIADLTARAVGEQMSKSLGQTIIVDNRPSAGGIVASQAVANAKPDGYTLLLMSNANAVSVGLFRKLPFDTQKAFSPISTLGYFDLGIFAPASSRFATLNDALVYARANPGKLNIGTINVGSTQQLAAKLFENEAGVEALVVPYKGTPAVLTALRTGEVDLGIEIVGPMLPHLHAGMVKALAVTSVKRHPALPHVPTAQEAGLTRYDVASWNALAAPAGTPPAIIDKLNKAAREAVAAPSVQAVLDKMGMRLQSSSPAEQQALLTSEIQRWGEVMRKARIQPE